MTTTNAFISTVNTDRTIVLPDSIPIGAKVAVLILPIEDDSTEEARNRRFEQTLSVIQRAISDGYTSPDISKQELKARIRRARKAAANS